jgi:hypothetical protein
MKNNASKERVELMKQLAERILEIEQGKIKP